MLDMKALFSIMLLATTALFGQIKAVVFDYGGVIAHADRAKVIEFLKSTFSASNELIESVNAESRRVRKRGGSELGFWEDFAAKRNMILPNDWMKELRKVILDSVRLDEELVKMIGKLKEKKVKVVLLSNIESHKAKVVKKMGHYDLFDDVILCHEVGISKPNPKIYEYTLDRLNLNGDECLFIDDDLDNVEAAKEFKMSGHHFCDTKKLQQTLQELVD